jgi:hypothetical protein
MRQSVEKELSFLLSLGQRSPRTLCASWALNHGTPGRFSLSSRRRREERVGERRNFFFG